MRFTAALAVLTVCFAFVILINADDNQDHKDWEDWKKEHNKSYKSDEEHAQRKKNYMNNKKKIDDHNKEHAAGNKTYSQKMNHLGDRHHDEMKAMRGHRARHHNDSSRAFPLLPSTRALPASVNWVTAGAVTPVKDQGQCGSCWTFAATGAIESHNYLHRTGKLVSMSEQNLLDCSSTSQYGNGGCSGGNAAEAMLYVKNNGGVDTEASYPYKAVQGSCRYSSASKAASDTGYVYVTGNSEAALMQAVATIGPVAIAIDASQSSFDFYHQGVYTEPACNPNNLDHAVLAVGYGHDTKTGLNYWLVKNSWNTWWGNQGYIWIAKDDNNMCGVASYAVYPSV